MLFKVEIQADCAGPRMTSASQTLTEIQGNLGTDMIGWSGYLIIRAELSLWIESTAIDATISEKGERVAVQVVYPFIIFDV